MINLENPNPECDYTPLVAKENSHRDPTTPYASLPQRDVRPDACAESPGNQGAQSVGLK
jgi:hypothetical protein